jgi:hypothetical protein
VTRFKNEWLNGWQEPANAASCANPSCALGMSPMQAMTTETHEISVNPVREICRSIRSGLASAIARSGFDIKRCT